MFRSGWNCRVRRIHLSSGRRGRGRVGGQFTHPRLGNQFARNRGHPRRRRRRGPCPSFHASTSEVYGKSQKDAFTEEDDLLIGPPHRSRWSYACSKLMDEFLGLAYARERSLPVVITRLFNTVGPRQTGRYGMVLPRFIAAARVAASRSGFMPMAGRPAALLRPTTPSRRSCVFKLPPPRAARSSTSGGVAGNQHSSISPGKIVEILPIQISPSNSCRTTPCLRARL